MRRRDLLSGVGVAIAGTAGCLSAAAEEQADGESVTSRRTKTARRTASATAPDGAVAESAPATESRTATRTDTRTAASLPSFEVGISSLGGIEVGQPRSYSVTVTNGGDRPAEFRPRLSYSTPEMTGWRSWDGPTPAVTVDAGSRRRLQYDLTGFTYLTTVTVRVGWDDRTTEATFVRETRSLGESYDHRDGFEITVTGVTERERYRTQGYRHDAPPGRKYAFASLSVENDSRTAVPAPTRADLSLIADGTQYHPDPTARSSGVYEGGMVQPGGVRSGSVAFEIPADASVTDVVYRDQTLTGDLAVLWRP